MCRPFKADGFSAKATGDTLIEELMSGWTIDLSFILFFLSLILCLSSGVSLITALVRSLVVLLVAMLLGLLGTALYERLTVPSDKGAKRDRDNGGLDEEQPR